MVIDLAAHIEAKQSASLAIADAFRAAQKSETVRRVRLEWILADILADLEAA